MSAVQRPRVKPSAFEEQSWRAYATRFLLGGTVATLAWYLGHRFGPVVGGLFLAFPAILPASITLVRSHAGNQAASNDALGAAVGSVGLIAFGAVVWLLAPHVVAWQVLGLATLTWLLVSASLWTILELAFGPLRDRQIPGA
jgi:hypothetical protein